uniref:RTP1_C1 domain-containing protein n=1 Tax=Parastrongyloides trichosuri TaxID=131310 RepID=A0A0N5A2I1_PARTI
MHDIIQLLDYVTTFHDVQVSREGLIKFDPIQDAYVRALERFEETNYMPRYVLYNESFEDLIGKSNDPRIKFTSILSFLYNNLIKELKETTNGEVALSVEQENIVSKSLQFYITTAIYPSLEPGVGIPITKLVKVPLKEWKKFDNKNICKNMLAHTIYLIINLVKCDLKLKMIILNTQLHIFIAANEQLMHYGNKDYECVYNGMLENYVCDINVFEALFIQFSDLNIPRWFKITIGKKLSKFLCRPNGLLHFLTAVQNVTDPNFFDNIVGVNAMANILGSCPFNVDRYTYYKDIVEQSISILTLGGEWRKKFKLLFGLLLDVVYKNYPTINESLINCILKPWKDLLKKGINSVNDPIKGFWNIDLDKSLVILETYLNTGKTFKVQISDALITSGFFYFWLNLTSHLDKETTLFSSFKNILMEILNNFDDGRKCKYLSDILLKKGKVSSLNYESSFFLLTKCQQSSLSTRVEESKYTYDDIKLIILDSQSTDEDEATAFQNRFDNVMLLLGNLNHVLKLITRFLKIINYSKFNKKTIEEVESEQEINNKNRFVNIDEAITSNDEKNFQIMFIVTNLMEFFVNKIGEMKDVCNIITSETVIDIIDVVCIIIKTFNRKMVSENDLSGDVENIKFGIASLGALMLVAEDNEEVKNSMKEIGIVLRKFIRLSGKYKQLEGLKNEAINVLDIITKFLGIAVEGVQINSDSKDDDCIIIKEVKKDLFKECLEDLKDNLEAVKGHGLIVIARELRKKNLQFLTEERLQILFDIVPEYVKDTESYVFLSGISVLAELAYLKPEPYLFKLIDMFINYPDKEDVAFRGKLGEAIAKVCKLLGYLGPQYFDQIFNVFIRNFKNEDEIIKASSLNAIADLICSCKGAKYNSVIHELFIGIDFLIKSQDSTTLVRRSTLHLLRSILQSTDTQMLLGTVIPSDMLIKIYRELKSLYANDHDDVVRLHAQLCLVDINENVKNSLLELPGT